MNPIYIHSRKPDRASREPDRVLRDTPESQALTLGSLFDGSGGFPLGGLLSGITPVWASEIEPFPIRVTTKRLPFMKHYGDVSQMDGGKIEPVDIITFGSPCQDLSIAGKRKGLGGDRSCLFYEAIRVIREMLSATGGRYPRFVIWENVPGALSSHGGKDFEIVFNELLHLRDFAGGGTDKPIRQHGRWAKKSFLRNCCLSNCQRSILGNPPPSQKNICCLRYSWRIRHEWSTFETVTALEVAI